MRTRPLPLVAAAGVLALAASADPRAVDGPEQRVAGRVRQRAREQLPDVGRTPRRDSRPAIGPGAVDRPTTQPRVVLDN